MRDQAFPHRPGRLRRGLAAGLCLGVLGAPVAAGAATAAGAPSAATVPVRVSPGAGGATTTFRISIRRPASTGGTGTFRRHDSVTVSGPRRRGCVGAAQRPMPDGAAGTRAVAVLDPRRLGGRWCRGAFTGVVTESESESCGGAQHACPFLVIAPRTIGRFRFRVS